MTELRIYCNTCRTQTWHERVAAHSHSRLDQLFGFSHEIDSSVLICRGCEDVSFRLVKHPFEFQAEGDGPEELVLPDWKHKLRERKYFWRLPKHIEELYRETVSAHDANLTLLSTVGVRGGLIEAIVADKISPQNYKDRLDSKIDSLLAHFPETVIETLHEFRKMGNKAVHKLEAPESLNIHHALYVIEGIMEFFYGVEQHAKLFSEHRKE